VTSHPPECGRTPHGPVGPGLVPLHGPAGEHERGDKHHHGDEHEQDGHVDPRGGHSHGPDAEHGHEHEHADGVKGFLLSIFRPHSHDTSGSVDSALEASSEGIRAVKISLTGLGVTAVAQLVVVLITGSVALLADTIHNFSDALTAIPLWIAFVLSRRAATRRYTYGYGRAEDLAGVFIVAMIALSSAVAGFESIRRLIGFAGNELVAIYRIRVGRRIGSAALVADGLHARTDGFTSLAVVFGAIGVLAGFPAGRPDRRTADHGGDPGRAARRRPRHLPAAYGRGRPGPGRRRRRRPGRGARGRGGRQCPAAMGRTPDAGRGRDHR